MTGKIDVSKLPDPEHSGENLDEAGCEWFRISGYGVFEWTSERDGKGVPTEVHLVLEIGPNARTVMMLKSARAVDELIAVLMRHRNSVFGSEQS